ncbi:HelD family protein [Streptosporangium roseum]|uniref:Superfamily I DNA and RNA helicase-like protein n=1 Tax=Streptosporangium roseum (strain ATCC 12428 / DSM 43021 / JCM 3005 / KCTC 9067 / NCIMB 10171 / NRRL 2505 / NI 9100) TaxID=479432 RepID=D2B7L9_STRRD|nr:AAA family ATPase [Streptosporangium roseum]ACZ91540.1 Superfamily I DNA and RNA helicase-like protein [Streptosporangium roseum DSM 43021]
MPAHQLAPDITDDPAETLAAEREHLAASRAALRAMREHAQSLSSDAAGDWVSQQILQALLDQRVAALADHSGTPLFFGRLDRAVDDDLPGTIYVGRRHVHDERSRPLVIDWRAPVSRAFYQASPSDPMDVALRRRFGYHGGDLTAYEDEPLDQGGALQHSRILTEEIERPRSGPMRDIVATIQPDQDEIVRSELGRTVCVQGAPGTGKTAVGLHRAAYLLFTHREKLARSGVMIVGPNRAFLSYISSVLPALGEVKVDQTTVAGILGDHSAPEDPAVSAVKGDARIAPVLRRALWMHIVKPTEGVLFTKGVNRYRVADHEVREVVASLRGTTRYGPGRAALAQRLAHLVLVRMEQRGESPDDRVQDAVARSKPVKQLVEQVWPKLTPQQVLHRLFSDPEFLAAAAKDDLTAAEQAMLLWAKPAKSHRSAKWSAADGALMDELGDLIERTAPLGHLVVDEAQDLSAMQLRALGRRCRTGSATVLGDLAQGTTPWSARSWDEVLTHLGFEDGAVTELTLGFRVPREVLDYAARLLPAVAPDLAAPRSLRPGAGSLSVRPATDPAASLTQAVREALSREGSIGVIVPDASVAAVSESLSQLDHRVLSPDSVEEHRLLVIPATLAKGLEYDHVIVVEPADIVDAEPRGLARLYVVLTRAVTSLTVLHARELPALLC